MAHRLLIVDDSPYYRLRFSKIFSRSADLQVVGLAEDGDIAIKQIHELSPDVVLLDLLMPKLDGFGVLRWVMANRPLPIIVCSSYSDRDRVFKALELGAIDFLLKPTPRATSLTSNLEDRIIRRVEDAVAAKVAISAEMDADRKAAYLAAEQAAYGACVELICIAASTGGPAAIQRLVAEFPRSMTVPIVIAQHMPEGFTRPFASRLDSISHYKVIEARDGDKVRGKHIYIAPAGFETRIIRNGDQLILSVSSSVASTSHAPSADELFSSAAKACGERTLAVVLTGMGQDGANGAEIIRRAGGHVIAESNESAIVFGMPLSVIERGCASAMLPLWVMPPILFAYTLKE
jgi:two-component system chemotaxis response regulator CheB